MNVTVFSNFLKTLVADDISPIDLGSSLFLSKQSKWLGNQNRELENMNERSHPSCSTCMSFSTENISQ